ncbi:oxamate amidohydrolase proenzyme-like [Plodia interpunctella]|uniref:oxamate amidohydrolase proenzyme-like n=1 Tax=Plodia interpunctella TaxID=58824 RepID=UPI002367F636|nr:oxamate amidohydrolase proenzyme-like [Plodia interpunctella]XP_053603305.1 oxamate amidohydrolase proenzyme-like [Plodia interpunctella]
MSFQTEFSTIATRGMAVTPHHLACMTASSILKQGGTAMEATIAAAATLAVVNPAMNSIGGDGFWLIVPPHEEPFVIEACGASGSLATEEFYKGFSKVPKRGPRSASTVAGTISGWQEALNYVSECGYSRLSVHQLLKDAIYYAENGYAISALEEADLTEYVKSETVSEDFKNTFMPNGTVPAVGEIFKQKQLAKTLKDLAENGLNSFYTGNIAKLIAEDMKSVGMPITGEDLAKHSAVRKVPLRLAHEHGELLNSPPPTQGAVSLSILGILDALKVQGQHEGVLIHTSVEATKQAFILRENITDPRDMKLNPDNLVKPANIIKMAKNIDLNKTSKSGNCEGPGDTVWMGVMDDRGFNVSFIQSVYHPYGSGIVLPQTGILWHNRGITFSLDKNHVRYIKPGKKPLHTLNPAAAKLKDGRIMVYGTRGGDGQPQTQAAIFHRYVVQDLNLQMAVSAPRWLYGDTLDKDLVDVLRLEDRFSKDTLEYLKERGHVLDLMPAFSAKFGIAGALVRHVDGRLEGAFDPRGNGSAIGY